MTVEEAKALVVTKRIYQNKIYMCIEVKYELDVMLDEDAEGGVFVFTDMAYLFAYDVVGKPNKTLEFTVDEWKMLPEVT